MRNILILFISLMVVTQAKAGPQGPILPPGNEGPYGGGGVVCGKTLITAQILDLWEAEAFKKLPLTHYETPVKEQVQKALDTYSKLNGLLPEEVKETTWRLYESVEMKRENAVPVGLEIAPPSDVLSPFIPTADSFCSFKGIAAYEDMAQILYVDYLLYDALRLTDKAALFIHEAFYKYLRDHYKVKNSIAARNITACLFADKPCAELSPMDGLPKEGPIYSCHPEGWLDSVVGQAAYDSEDYRLGEPIFYLFPQSSKSDEMKTVNGFYPWRFQLVMMKMRKVLTLKGYEPQNVPTRNYFDVQMELQNEIELQKNGYVSTYALSPQGSLDMLMTTYSSDTDPWRKALGPRFSYRLKPSQTSLAKAGSVYLEVNGFPLVCEKLR